jgi:hypothetical protein
VGGPNTRSVGRAIAFTAVAALHVGLFVVLTASLGTRTRRPVATAFITTFVSLPAPRGPSVSPPHSPNLDETAPVLPLDLPLIPPSRFNVPHDAGAAIDWNAEAQRAARAVTSTPSVRNFGRIPEAPFWLGPVPSLPKRHAGEQDRLDGGDSIFWVSDRCYVVSSIPLLGMPDILERSMSTRTVCKDDSDPQGDLFKDLPAYKKHHSR